MIVIHRIYNYGLGVIFCFFYFVSAAKNVPNVLWEFTGKTQDCTTILDTLVECLFSKKGKAFFSVLQGALWCAQSYLLQAAQFSG